MSDPSQTRENLTVDDLVDPDVLAEVTNALGKAQAADATPEADPNDVIEVGDAFDSLPGASPEATTGAAEVDDLQLPATPAPAPAPLPPVGPTIDLPTELGAKEAGQMALGKVSTLKVLFGCALCKSSGIARFRSDEGSIKLLYTDGVVVALETSIARLSPSDASPDGAVASTKAALAELVGWAGGACHFAPGNVKPPQVPLGLDRFKTLDEAIRAGLDEAALKQRLGQVANRGLLPNKIGEIGVQDLDLFPREKEVFASLDGVRCLDDLLAEAGDDAEQRSSALRAVYLGVESELLKIGHGPNGRAQLLLAKEIEQTLHGYKATKSYLDVLGVPAEGSDADLRTRYYELKRKYSPPPEAKQISELSDAQQRMLEFLEKAYKAAASQQTRARSASSVTRASHPAPRPTSTAGVASMVSSKPAAGAISSAELFIEAEGSATKGNYKLALEQIAAAIETRPDKVEYLMYQKYYKVLEDKYDRRGGAVKAIKEIRKMIKEDDEIFAAHLVMGRLFKYARRKDLSFQAFTRAAELDPSNEEAQREVRIGSNRKGGSNKVIERRPSLIDTLKKKLIPEDPMEKTKRKRKDKKAKGPKDEFADE